MFSENEPRVWLPLTSIAVGGLTGVGFVPDSEFLLVMSSQGRGVFSLSNGQRVARDSNDSYDWFDEQTLYCQGIGPSDGMAISIAGLWGGRLVSATPDGWSISATPEGFAIRHRNGYQEFIDEDEEIQALGFDPSERHFVIATPSTLTIYLRSNTNLTT